MSMKRKQSLEKVYISRREDSGIISKSTFDFITLFLCFYPIFHIAAIVLVRPIHTSYGISFMHSPIQIFYKIIFIYYHFKSTTTVLSKSRVTSLISDTPSVVKFALNASALTLSSAGMRFPSSSNASYTYLAV